MKPNNRTIGLSFFCTCVLIAAATACGAVGVWSPRVNVTKSADIYGGVVAADSNRIHVVIGRAGQALYSFWITNEVKSPEVFLGNGVSATIAADGLGRLHLVYSNDWEARYRRWSNGAWEPGVTMVSGGSGGVAKQDICADSQNNVHVVWAKDGNIWYNRRSASTGAWDGPQQVSYTGDMEGYLPPRAAAVGTAPVIVWGRAFGGSRSVWFSSKESGSWTSIQLPTNGTGASACDISVGPTGTVYCTWDDNYHIWDIERIGGVWQPLHGLKTGPSMTSTSPRVSAASASKADIVWAETEPGYGDIWSSRWNGSGWSSASTVTGVTSGGCVAPDISGDSSGYQYAMWGQAWDLWLVTDKPDTTPPPSVTQLTVTAGDGQVVLSWVNPAAIDLANVRVVYRTDRYPTSVADGATALNRAASPGSDLFTHTGLTNNTTYYYGVFLSDEVPNYSAATASAMPKVMTCTDIKRMGDGQPMNAKAKVVTAIFGSENCFYVEESTRACGIRVASNGAGLLIGDRVDIAGVAGTLWQNSHAAERQISSPVPSNIVHGTPLKPLALNCEAVGGASIPPTMPGVKDANGLNNIGLLVKLAGKVTLVLGNYVYIDDGGSIEDVDGKVGVMVESPSAPTVVAGNIVSATGIVQGSIPSGWTENRRYIKLRSAGDLALISSNMGTVSGYVTDSSWNGVSGATVSTTSGGYSATTNSAGAYTLTNVIAGKYTVTAAKAGYTTASSNITLSANQNLALDLTINQSTGTIQGLVRNSLSVGISGAVVSTNTGGYTATTNSSGAYTINYVNPGAYSVTASKAGYVPQTLANKSVAAGGVTYANFVLTASP